MMMIYDVCVLLIFSQKYSWALVTEVCILRKENWNNQNPFIISLMMMIYDVCVLLIIFSKIFIGPSH